MKRIDTPYYLIDERRLLKNLERIAQVREASGAKSVLALKCFSTWSVFKLMARYMDGTTSSSLYEARLGHEEFGKETHAYSVGYSKSDIKALRKFADKIIFNSASQLKLFLKDVKGMKIGLRANPGTSNSHFDLANPARKHSRLGVVDLKEIEELAPLLSGLMFHFNCENDDFGSLCESLDRIGRVYGPLLKGMEWVSLGGGIAFTKDGYPLDKFCAKLKSFSSEHGVQIYLEPGEAAITCSAELVASVLDVVRNEGEIAILDVSMEAHMLDHLIYRTNPRVSSPGPGPHKVMLAGRSCLAGDVFGSFELEKPLKPGDEVRLADAAGYTMVKKNWFNGLPMPSIAVRRLDGTLELARKFGYKDFKGNLS